MARYPLLKPDEELSWRIVSAFVEIEELKKRFKSEPNRKPIR